MTLRAPGARKSEGLKARFISWWGRVSTETNLPYSIGILVLCLLILLVWKLFWSDVLYDLRVEFWGLVFDVMFILVVFSAFERRRQKFLQIQNQHDIIDDYKAWDSEEARFRLAGAFRRLNKMGVYAVNLAGARMTDFSFPKLGIKSLTGSTFYDGDWGQAIGDSRVVLSKVDFSYVDCRSVIFSPRDPFAGLVTKLNRHARFEDCTFIQTDLRKATFNGASLTWSDRPPEDHYHFDEDAETGEPFVYQMTFGPFDGADLTNTSFVECAFENADFRGALELLEADFSGATGLVDAHFDNDHLKSAVLAAASNGAARKIR